MLLAGLLGLAACGGDDEPAPAADDAATTTTGEAPAPTDAPSDTTGDTTGDTADGGAGDGAVLTGADVCAAVTADAVAAATGLEITGAEAPERDTPQCSYTYGDAGPSSNLTIAWMRPDEDLGGRAGTDGFAYVVELNRALATDEEVELDAGDEAVRLTGSGLHLGVVRVGDRVFTVTVPAADAGPEAADALVGAVAQAFA
ncbi:MAG: hypothetical protein KatS3mg009_1352 [Acidimicrobiia bacterium]|nr:MAG: hypothetical protein KatS3mg009_1352 [Acidimicrobiia bacterium]